MKGESGAEIAPIYLVFLFMLLLYGPGQPFPDSLMFCQPDLKILFWGHVCYQNVSKTLKEQI